VPSIEGVAKHLILVRRKKVKVRLVRLRDRKLKLLKLSITI
jgi:hypothetical protein